MALIGTLRNKMGTWVVVFVFVAISAFVLNDLFSGQSAIFNLGQNDIGEIAGKSISLEQYQAVLREREANYYMNFNREPGERERPLIQEQAWELLIARNAIETEYEKTGVSVTNEEILDMIYGKNVDPNLKGAQAFLNETGEFDRTKVQNYLAQIRTMPETSEPRIRWDLFQRDLGPARKRIKYENLLLKTFYITTAEAEREYHVQNDVAEVKYLYVPYYTISDSAAKPTDSDFTAYYNKNKEKFKTGQTRDMSYVVFPINPSPADSLAIRQELVELKDDFKTTKEDSTFATVNSEGRETFGKYSTQNLPSFINTDSLQLGKVMGPFLDGNTYKLVKLSSTGRDTVFTARARHILIRWADDADKAKLEANKKEAKAKARNILNEIKAGADFAVKAMEHGTDGTKNQGGDLGWFSSGQMVKPFENAVFGATKKGLLNDVVETEYGYHIVEVTGEKNNTYYKIAVIQREITPGDETINETMRNAENFQSELSGLEAFKEKAKKSGLTVMEANGIAPSERRVGILGEARSVVQWLFRDASEGKVSDVLSLDGQYVVGIMTGEVEKGYKPLARVKEEITPAVKNEVRGRIIIEKLKGQKGTLEEIANAFGPDAGIYSSSDLKMSSSSLPTVGFDPKAVGKAFSMEKGNRTAPMASENGVLIMEIQNLTIAPAIDNVGIYKEQLQTNLLNKVSFSIADALKEKADIEDMRYKYY